MNFKDHIIPTLHNAVGGLITTAVVALIGALIVFVQPIGDAVMSSALYPVPVWGVLLICAALALPLVALIKRLRIMLSAMQQELADMESNLAEAQSQMTEAQKKQQALNAVQAKQNSIPRRNWVTGWRDGL